LELIGIGMGILGGIFAAPAFCFMLVKLLKLYPTFAHRMFYPSIFMLCLFAVHLYLMEKYGVIGSRQLLGAAFPRIDAFVTLLSPPALAGTLILGKRNFARFWLVIAAICWLIGIYAIFHQYHLWEQLYGVDGIGGPYSNTAQ
jgi:hypothetical protein